MCIVHVTFILISIKFPKWGEVGQAKIFVHIQQNYSSIELIFKQIQLTHNTTLKILFGKINY